MYRVPEQEVNQLLSQINRAKEDNSPKIQKLEETSDSSILMVLELDYLGTIIHKNIFDRWEKIRQYIQKDPRVYFNLYSLFHYQAEGIYDGLELVQWYYMHWKINKPNILSILVASRIYPPILAPENSSDEEARDYLIQIRGLAGARAGVILEKRKPLTPKAD